MENLSKHQKLTMIQSHAYSYRGQIINDMIFIERIMDDILTRHFTNKEEKQKELMELVFGNERTTFNGKLQVFKYIVDKYYKEEFGNKNPEFNNELTKLSEERNIVAHYLLDTSDDGIAKFLKDGTIGFIRFKNSTEIYERTHEKYLHFHDLQMKYTEALTTFQNQLIKTPPLQ